MNVKLDECKNILQKWDLIAVQNQKNATKQKKLETAEVNIHPMLTIWPEII